jgi:DNA repair protein RadC
MIPVIDYEVRRTGIVPEKTVLNRKQAAKAAFTAIPDDGREYFIVFLLTGMGHVIGQHLVSIGTTEGTFSRPVEVFRAALLTPGCASIIAAHNHPNGSVRLSRADRRAAKSLTKAGALLGIHLSDYLVIAHHEPGTGRKAYASAMP